MCRNMRTERFEVGKICYTMIRLVSNILIGDNKVTSPPFGERFLITEVMVGIAGDMAIENLFDNLVLQNVSVREMQSRHGKASDSLICAWVTCVFHYLK